MMNTRTWIVACLAMALMAPAWAQDGGGRGGRGEGGGRGGRAQAGGRGGQQQMMKAAWEKVDKEACFAAMDADKDGNVTAEEFEKADVGAIFGKALMEAMKELREEQTAGGGMKRLDQNKDGKITADEFPGGEERFNKLLERADTDGDGALSEDEMNAFREKARAQRGGRGGRGGNR